MPPSHMKHKFSSSINGTSGSSSSSSKSSSSTDSTLSSSAPAIVRVIQDTMSAKEDASSLEEDTIDTPITNISSVKQYRNSPFGLTRHYLTMPDAEHDSRIFTPTIGQGKFKDRKRTGMSTEDVGDYHPKQLEATWNKKHSGRPGKLNVCIQPSDLSVLAVSSTNSLSSGYDHHKDNVDPKEIDPMEHLVALNHFTRPPAAGDAGLDAKKCNQKDVESAQEDCFFEIDPMHNPDLLARNKLNMVHNFNSPLICFSSIMYATFLVILGCILHVSELRQKSKNSSDHIYTIVVAVVGILWLLFLQTDLQRYKRYASKYIIIETIFNDQHLKRKELMQAGSDLNPPSTRSTTSSSASLVNDRMSMNTEVIFKKTAYKMYQQRAALERSKTRANRHLDKSKLTHPTHIPRNGAYKTSSADLSLRKPSPVEGSTDDLVPAYKFLHGKMNANFYLKCGMAAFCFGHIIHEGLRFGQQLYFFGNGNMHCRDSAALLAHLITPLYSFYLLFMMFKYSNLVINRHKVLANFGLMHIIGTSITFWFRTIIEEAFEDFVHKMDYFKSNKSRVDLNLVLASNHDPAVVSLLSSITNTIEAETNERSDWTTTEPNVNQNISIAQSLLSLMSSPISATITPQMVRHLPDSYACAQNTLLTTKSMNALPYLYPFTIEYNLLLAATFLGLYFNIGKIGEPESVCRPAFANNSKLYSNTPLKVRSLSGSLASQHAESSDSSNIRTMKENEKEMGEYKSNFVVNADCHSANKGLFCGFFVLLVTLVTIVIFFVTINKPTHIQLGIKINLIQEATLTTIILIVTLAGFKQVVKLNRNPYLKDKVTTDDVLMLIPLPFFFIHSLLSFRAETASMSTGNSVTSISSSSTFSSMILHENHLNGAITHPSGNLHSAFLNTNNNNTQTESRIRLNNLMAGHSNGTNGRFVESFISNINNRSNSSNRVGGSSSSNNNNNRSSSSSSSNSNSNNNSGSSSSSRNSRNISRSSSGSNGLDADNSYSQIDHFKLITVALNIIVMIEVLVQTNFIIDGMRRCSESRYLRFKKPGRELITFAILLNITYWIVATFETKSVEQYKTEIEYYGPLPYMFISHTTLPVMLFYRYHSSVCLAEIWNRAYKSPKKR